MYSTQESKFVYGVTTTVEETKLVGNTFVTVSQQETRRTYETSGPTPVYTTVADHVTTTSSGRPTYLTSTGADVNNPVNNLVWHPLTSFTQNIQQNQPSPTQNPFLQHSNPFGVNPNLQSLQPSPFAPAVHYNFYLAQVRDPATNANANEPMVIGDFDHNLGVAPNQLGQSNAATTSTTDLPGHVASSESPQEKRTETQAPTQATGEDSKSKESQNSQPSNETETIVAEALEIILQSMEAATNPKHNDSEQASTPDMNQNPPKKEDIEAGGTEYESRITGKAKVSFNIGDQEHNQTTQALDPNTQETKFNVSTAPFKDLTVFKTYESSCSTGPSRPGILKKYEETKNYESQVVFTSCKYWEFEKQMDAWFQDLEDSERLFISQAGETIRTDLELFNNREKLEVLRSTINYYTMVANQMDNDIDNTNMRGEEVDTIIGQLSSVLHEMPAGEKFRCPRTAIFSMIEAVDLELTRRHPILDEVLALLKEHSPGTTAQHHDPVHQIAGILNAHISTLEKIDRKMLWLDIKIEEVSKLFHMADHQFYPI